MVLEQTSSTSENPATISNNTLKGQLTIFGSFAFSRRHNTGRSFCQISFSFHAHNFQYQLLDWHRSEQTQLSFACHLAEFDFKYLNSHITRFRQGKEEMVCPVHAGHDRTSLGLNLTRIIIFSN